MGRRCKSRSQRARHVREPLVGARLTNAKRSQIEDLPLRNPLKRSAFATRSNSAVVPPLRTLYNLIYKPLAYA